LKERPKPGGAAARPFTTHHNALDLDLKLRIAPELYLKRLVVGGMDRVYEINRNFRNEGISTQHNPEFTMLEFYQAYSNYEDLMKLTKELIAEVANKVNGTTKTTFNGAEIDLAPENWQQLSMREAVIKFWHEGAGNRPELAAFESVNSMQRVVDDAIANLELHYQALTQQYEAAKLRRTVPWKADEAHRSEEEVIKLINGKRMGALVYRDELKQIAMRLQQQNSPGKSIADVFELFAEEHLQKPTIIYDFPLAVSPLSKQKPDEPDWVERFEFYIGGFEVGNAFSELNDPDDQRRRFEDQLKERDRGDDEAHAMDEDYVRALGYGLPPTAGEGIGIDRLTMILTGSKSIRDVIFFPLLRPQAKSAEPATE
jgi:lysyl-tRNA synthetase class 2